MQRFIIEYKIGEIGGRLDLFIFDILFPEYYFIANIRRVETTIATSAF